VVNTLRAGNGAQGCCIIHTTGREGSLVSCSIHYRESAETARSVGAQRGGIVYGPVRRGRLFCAPCSM
jgi:hypothetical protein